MIPKKFRIIPVLALVIALLLTTGCSSQPENGLVKGVGDTQHPGAAPVRATGITVTHDSLVAATGNASLSVATPLLGRPTDKSVNVNVVPAETLEIFLEYRDSNNTPILKTPAVFADAGIPTNIEISGLAPDTGYIYKLCYRKPGGTAVRCSPEFSFHTQRGPGSSFVFDIQADSHLDERASGDLYQRTLSNQLGDKPDFLIDLGDTFMTDKLPVKNKETYLNQYLEQRFYQYSRPLSATFPGNREP
jgi:hypothetical protein